MRGRLGIAAVGLLALAACGSASSVSAPPTGPPTTAPSSTSPAPVTLPCHDGRVSIATAQALTVTCGSIMKLRVTGAALVQTGPDAFRGVASGTATILLTGEPACSPGTLCPLYRIADGFITVTVTG